MPYKVRDFVNAGILKTIYYVLFYYACIIWEQIVCTINRFLIPQKKASRLIHFKGR